MIGDIIGEYLVTAIDWYFEHIHGVTLIACVAVIILYLLTR